MNLIIKIKFKPLNFLTKHFSHNLRQTFSKFYRCPSELMSKYIALNHFSKKVSPSLMATSSLNSERSKKIDYNMDSLRCGPVCSFLITKTRLFKHIENFTTKNGKFSDKNLIFFIFLLKT